MNPSSQCRLKPREGLFGGARMGGGHDKRLRPWRSRRKAVVSPHLDRGAGRRRQIGGDQIGADRRAPHPTDYDAVDRFPFRQLLRLPKRPGRLELIGKPVDVGQHSFRIELTEALEIVEFQGPPPSRYTARFGQPLSPATSRAASERLIPEAVRSPRAERTLASVQRACSCAPPITSVTSPRGGSASNRRSASASVPRVISSCTFESSRQTATGRDGPRASLKSASDSTRRCGTSNANSVRRSPANERISRRRSARWRGR